jgi:sulfatase maturation enzyme AslB (radical SAM superfamily)
MKPWCTEPFLTLENKVYGPWGLCCRSKPLPYGPEVSPLEHWQSNTMERIRKDMIDHNITDEIKHLCQKCIQHEERGITSRRQQKLDRYIVLKPIDTIEIKFFGNLCNLKCKMCSGIYSSSIAAEEKKLGKWEGETVYNGFDKADKEKFYSDMEQILPYAKLIKFTGGEPTMNKGIVEFIQWIVDKGYSKHLQLKIITNGTKRNEVLLKLSKKFKKFIVAVSVDGTWDIDEYQRVGTVFEEVIENIKTYKHYADTTMYSVITALNVGNIADLVAFASAVEVPVDFSSIVLYPNHMQIEVLPVSYRQHLLGSYNYPREIRTALESEYWDEEGWDKLLQLNPDIFDVIPELRGFTT